MNSIKEAWNKASVFHTEQKKHWGAFFISHWSLILKQIYLGLQQISVLIRFWIWMKGKCLSLQENEEINRLVCSFEIPFIVCADSGITHWITNHRTESLLSHACRAAIYISQYEDTAIVKLNPALFSFLYSREIWTSAKYRRTNNSSYIYLLGFINSIYFFHHFYLLAKKRNRFNIQINHSKWN